MKLTLVIALMLLLLHGVVAGEGSEEESSQEEGGGDYEGEESEGGSYDYHSNNEENEGTEEKGASDATEPVALDIPTVERKFNEFSNDIPERKYPIHQTKREYENRYDHREPEPLRPQPDVQHVKVTKKTKFADPPPHKCPNTPTYRVREEVEVIKRKDAPFGAHLHDRARYGPIQGGATEFSRNKPKMFNIPPARPQVISPPVTPPSVPTRRPMPIPRPALANSPVPRRPNVPNLPPRTPLVIPTPQPVGRPLPLPPRRVPQITRIVPRVIRTQPQVVPQLNVIRAQRPAINRQMLTVAQTPRPFSTINTRGMNQAESGYSVINVGGEQQGPGLSFMDPNSQAGAQAGQFSLLGGASQHSGGDLFRTSVPSFSQFGGFQTDASQIGSTVAPPFNFGLQSQPTSSQFSNFGASDFGFSDFGATDFGTGIGATTNQGLTRFVDNQGQTFGSGGFQSGGQFGRFMQIPFGGNQYTTLGGTNDPFGTGFSSGNPNAI